MSEEFEEQIKALSQLEDYRKEVEQIFQQRILNLPPHLEKLRKQHQQNNLKSDLKKTTAFVKKIKVITSDGLLQCIRDVQTLNLTLYISEIVSSLVETNIKATDVSNVVKLCHELHIRYNDFTGPLINRMKETVLSQDEEVQKRKRIHVRMLIEFYQLGLFTEENFFNVLLSDLIGKSHANQQIDLSGLVTFIKYAAEVLMGYHSKRQHQLAKVTGRSLSDFPSKLIASQRTATELQMQLTSVCEKLVQDLEKSFKEMRSKEKRFEKDKLIHGTLSEQKVAELENCKRLFEKLMSSLSSISDATGLDIIPELKEEEENLDGSGGISLWEGANSSSTGVDFGPWGDAETKSFYEDLPDLLSMVPLSALGLTPEQAADMKETWKLNKEKISNGEIPSGVEKTYEDSPEDDDGEKIPEGGDPDDAENPDSNSTALTMHNKLMTLLQEKLPEAVNKQKCDEFCASFCYINTKKSKKHLVNALLRVPRTRYELIPNYARIAASLIRLYPEISDPLMDGLLKEFHGMLKTKNQQHIENKIKNIRFIGELIKFNVAPPITAFRIFQKLIGDFVHHNIDICATLLETCGRYLYLTPYTHERLENILSTVMRLRRAKNLDYRQQTALEAAYFTVKPPDRVQKVKKEYTVVQQYIQHLLFINLNKNTVEYIIKQLRKLPWGNQTEKIDFYVIKFTLKLARLKYSNVSLVTDCLSGLSKYHPNLLVRLVDVVFEELSRGLDAPHHREQQRLISYVRLLSELFNFSALSSSTIFDLLYYILSYGYVDELSVIILSVPSEHLIRHLLHSKKFSLSRPCEIDSPNDYFRIQLICEILESCGMYFTKGMSKMKLGDFLLYFQKYLLLKSRLPSHIEFSVLDMFDNLELHAHEILKKEKKSSGSTVISTDLCFPRYSKLEEVDKAIQQLEEMKEKNMGIEPEDDDSDEDEDADDHSTSRNKQENIDEVLEDEEDEDYARDTVEGNTDGQISQADAAKLMKMRVVEEDEEFEKAFRSLMLESVESAKPSSTAVGIRGAGAGDRMAIPAFLPPPKNVIHNRRSNDESDEDDSSDDEADDDNDQTKSQTKTMPFKLLGRDMKGRVETRRLLIPQDTKISLKLLQSTENQRLEKEKLKEKVLLYESLQASSAGETQNSNAAVPVEYLGNRDHFARGSNSQPTVESTKWRSSNNPQPQRDATKDQSQPVTSYDLNLDDFLAISSAAESRKIATTAPHRANVVGNSYGSSKPQKSHHRGS